MSALSDIMAGLRTVMELTSKVETLTANVDKLAIEVRDVDRRLVRVETMIEIARGGGGLPRIASDPGAND